MILQVSVINEPIIFYKTVLEKCRTAKRRITLASLYLGTGYLEEQLVRANEIMNNIWIIHTPLFPLTED
jgi:CDP-diacylglycerol--glycerol-3-phosphate 3-phosphatidyltransferase